ncbi:hypothetical protein M2I89_12785 [Pseudomonas aeruginosa]|nr:MULTISPECIES: hypothetical protein [Pseudomonas aeruginosa group]MCZ9819113.1 hypothetical protein [Pseudomonas aeruginosa]MCZ9833270.1 hypothetical protein [Pseudomonas aeruginosa]MCZ9863511.1 hypothetical protein [Pseudomonas aeruginosa]MCZ9903043.1 hypothetical protein [Pseudomonas aeruginosa]MDE9391507.1 hypothetical protein [Pseudomonas aeruginosa]
MPIPPQPYVISCTSCRWKKTIIPLSDVLALGWDWFANCPQCGCEALRQRPASQAEILRARIERFLRVGRW